MNLKLEYAGAVKEYSLFRYEVDGEDHITRIKEINNGKNYELAIGFGSFRTTMVIDSNSKMGTNIKKQIKQNDHRG